MEKQAASVFVIVIGLLCVGAVGMAAGQPSADASSGPPEISSAHEFVVSINETSATTEGESLTVTVDVENVGTEMGTETIELQTPGLGTDSTNVTLSGGESTVVELSVDTAIEDAAGSPYAVLVTSASDTDSATVAVQLPPVGGFSNPPTDQTGDGKYEDVDGSGKFDIFDVQALFNNLDDQSVQTHPWAFDFDENDKVDIFDVQSVFNKLGGETGQSAVFDVTLTDVPANITAGETLNLAYEVENVGGGSGSQTVEFSVNGESVDTQSVSLAPGETFNGSFSYITDADDAPGAVAGVASEDDTDSAVVTIDAGDFDLVASLGDELGVVGGSVQVSLDVASFDSEGGDTFDSYTTVVTYDESVLNFTGIAAAEWNPSSINQTDGTVVLSSSAPSGSTPLEPALSYEFEVVGEGTSSIEFDSGAADADNQITDENGTAYEVQFLNGSVTGDSPPSFDVVTFDAPTEVPAGESLTVNYTVENTGGLQGTQDIAFLVDGTQVDGESDVTLDANATFEGSFTYDTTGDGGEVLSAAISTANDSQSTDVTVLESATFELTAFDAPTGVTAGETITVDYTVENTGDVQGTQDIDFLVDGTAEGNESGVTLDANGTFDSSFSYDTTGSGGETLSVAVATDNSTQSANVDVLAPANFAFTSVNTPDEVVAGENFTVNYTVENTGDLQGTQDIRFLVYGAQEDIETNVTLYPNETFDGSFDYDTTGSGGETLSVAVSTANETEFASGTVLERANFEFVALDAPPAVTEGDLLVVDYVVENTGGVQGTQDIDFLIYGSQQDIESNVSLSPNETFSSSFAFDTEGNGGQTLPVEVRTDNDSRSANVDVLRPPNFQILAFEAPGEVTAGDPLIVNYTVENTGDIQGVQDIDFFVNGTQEGLESNLSLSPGETFSSSFTYDTTGDGDKTLPVEVSTDNDTRSTGVTVSIPTPTFELTGFQAPSKVTAGEFITVDYTVENTGDIPGTQDIEFLVNGTQEDSESNISLDTGAQFSGSFSYNTTASDGDQTLNVSVSTDNVTQSADVNVPSPDLEASMNATQGTVGETIKVGIDVVSVEGTGDEIGSYTFVISFNDSVLNFTGASGADWNDPLGTNDFGDALSTTSFSPGGSTPSQPGLVLEFEIVGEGTSTIEFDDEVSETPSDNEINDENAESYNVLYGDGAAGTTISGTASVRDSLATTGTVANSLR